MANIKSYIMLQILLFVYSLSGVFSKLASQYKFLSLEFTLCYVIIIFLLGIYAIVWQQIIKKMPLTNAYANKAISIVWGLIWGLLFFSENITIGKIIGCLLVIIGVVIFSLSDKKSGDNNG